MKTNPILKTLKEGDIVMIETPQPNPSKPPVEQICKIRNLRYTEADEKCPFDWMDFDEDVLYTNMRTHKSMINNICGNCMAITEVLNNVDLELYAKAKGLWKSDLYLMSDAELEQQKQFVNTLLNADFATTMALRMKDATS